MRLVPAPASGWEPLLDERYGFIALVLFDEHGRQAQLRNAQGVGERNVQAAEDVAGSAQVLFGLGKPAQRSLRVSKIPQG